jgi:DNA primase
VFTFDGDAAGQKAALHAFALDSAFLSQTFVAVADGNLDPCDLRIEQGNEAVVSLIDNARPLYDFVIDTAINRFDTSFTTGQMGAVKAVAPLIAQIRDRSLFDIYTRKATRRIGVDLDIMRREVNTARRQLRIRDEDAYAPKRRYATANTNTGFEERGERGSNTYDNPARRKSLERRDANEQTYYHIDDAVFICEQQFMATLIQVPRAIDRAWFAQLTLANFMTPVFRSLFQAIAAAGGLPGDDTPQGLWMHNLTKAGGSLLQQVINELAVMPLPLPAADKNASNAADSHAMRNGSQPTSGTAEVQLRPATPAETQYASELLARLLDMGFMRKIGAAKRHMTQLPDGEEKITVLGRITQLETARKDLQAQIYGNTVG